MSISKTAIIEPQTKIEQGRAGSIGAGGHHNHHQKLNKSMSESHIDTSRIRQKYAQSDSLKHSTTEHPDLETDPKNGCSIM